MAVDSIDTHVEDALNRLIEQYKGSDNLKEIITAFVAQIQDLEDVGIEMFLNRFVDNAVGIQLDRFGEIVDFARQGFDDEFYRILLKVKIGINISSGEPPAIISTMKLLTQASLVHYQNLGNGNISLAVDTEIDADLIDFFYTNMQKVVMAGVRIASISSFDPDESFSFDGTGPIGLGFSSTGAPLTGGKLAFLNRRTKPEYAIGSIAGASDANSSGFGTLQDVLAGGIMQGL